MEPTGWGFNQAKCWKWWQLNLELLSRNSHGHERVLKEEELGCRYKAIKLKLELNNRSETFRFIKSQPILFILIQNSVYLLYIYQLL